MNKKVLKIAGGIVFLGGVFLAGSYTGATTDLFTNAENKAYSDMLGVANSVNNQIEDNATDDIKETLTEGIDQTVDANQDELKRLLEEYYQLKLQGLTDSPRFHELETKIRQTMLSVNSAFRDKIDQVFIENGVTE